MVGHVTSAPRLAEPASPTEAAALYQGDLAYIQARGNAQTSFSDLRRREVCTGTINLEQAFGRRCSIQYFDHKIIYLCEYLEDGYSANFAQNLRRNPRGFGVYYKHQIGREKEFDQEGQVPRSICSMSSVWRVEGKKELT